MQFKHSAVSFLNKIYHQCLYYKNETSYKMAGKIFIVNVF